MLLNRALAASVLGLPTSLVPKVTCRCRLVKSTTSKSTKPDLADARSRQVKPQRRAQATGPDQQDPRAFQLELALHANFRHDQVPAITQNLFVGQARCRWVAGQRRCLGGHSVPLMNILPVQRDSEKPIILAAGRPGATKFAGRFAAANPFGLTVDK